VVIQNNTNDRQKSINELYKITEDYNLKISKKETKFMAKDAAEGGNRYSPEKIWTFGRE
jgi:hypothetical protein